MSIEAIGFGICFLGLLGAFVLRFINLRRLDKAGTGEAVDLSKIGREIPITYASRGDPGDPEMVTRIEKKLKKASNSKNH